MSLLKSLTNGLKKIARAPQKLIERIVKGRAVKNLFKVGVQAVAAYYTAGASLKVTGIGNSNRHARESAQRELETIEAHNAAQGLAQENSVYDYGAGTGSAQIYGPQSDYGYSGDASFRSAPMSAVSDSEYDDGTISPLMLAAVGGAILFILYLFLRK